MPQTIVNTDDLQIIGGAFSSHYKATQAAGEFRRLGYHGSNVQVITKKDGVIKVESVLLGKVETSLFMDGVTKAQSEYYVNALNAGRTVLLVYNVSNSAPVIDIFDRYGAEYNPNGQRNLRNDVAGMTFGAMAGAAAVGILGSVVAGPLGMAAGIPTGAVIGGAAGGSIGMAAEHKK